MTTNAELAILSLLAEKPRHGYDIEQIIEQRGMRNWTDIGFSSIYYLLNKLEKAGEIQGHLETSSGKGPSRKVYELSEAGRKDWREAVLTALSHPEPCHQPVQIGLSNLPLLPRDQAQTALTGYLKNLRETHADLAKRQISQEASLPYQVKAMFGLSLAIIDAEIGWLESFLQELDQLSDEQANLSEGPDQD